MQYATYVAAVLLLGSNAAADEPGTPNEPPAYKLLRAAEDYSYLATDEEPQYEYDWFDPIKYISLADDGNVAHHFGVHHDSWKRCGQLNR